MERSNSQRVENLIMCESFRHRILIVPQIYRQRKTQENRTFGIEKRQAGFHLHLATESSGQSKTIF